MVEVKNEAQAIVLRTIYGAKMDRAAQVSTPAIVAFDHSVRAVETAIAAKEAENAELRAKVEKLREAAHNLHAAVNSPEGFSLSAVKSASEAVEAALTETQP